MTTKRNTRKATKGEKALLPSNVIKAFTKASPSLLEADSSAASAPISKLPEGKRISHLKLGPALLEAKATPEEITSAFRASFNARGVTDEVWITKRQKIYMEIARKKAIRARAAEKATATK